ncbi:hypothetical protein ACJIZ3_001912 [Penstemon smallii]|uniref:Protein kinase domain-containing protein n=1 Tax=Penstemon smallii TaxID=265156 RepID=A0ABD3U4Y6_9LAMI
MEQFRQVGEIVGGLKALMVLNHEISINQKQCCLLFDMLELAFETISEVTRQNLRFEERYTRWKALELPMKELHKIFKEADFYIRHCLNIKDWWGKAITLHMNRDCVEFHIHNLFCCLPVVIEAIETASEISGVDQEEMQKRRITLMKKYDQDCDNPKLFQWKFGKKYLVPKSVCSRLGTVWKEDKWLLLEKIEEKKTTTLVKNEQRIGDLLLKKLNASNEKLPCSNILVGAEDYYVKRRLGSGGGRFKEIHWLGESFALRTFFGDIEPLNHEISLVLSLSHPNVLQYLCAFYDEDRKEGFLVMELMSKDLGTYIKENSSQKKRILFSIPIAVDILLQIARGMEYLHSKKIYHGDLNPSNILLKARNASTEGLFTAKVTGFGLTSVKNYAARSPKPSEIDLDIWLAPEVLAEIEHPSNKCTTKYTEKADVYSFGMLCFEILTGKIPFEDSHLQGEKMIQNIRAGVRPLFSYPSPKYLANLTRKCWQSNPNIRPTFSSICRMLRCVKKNLVINPNHGHPDSPPPLVDYCDMEAGFLKRFFGLGNENVIPVVEQIPFQMFAYRLVEMEKISGKNWDLSIDGSRVQSRASISNYDDLFLVPSDERSVCSEIIDRKNGSIVVDLRSVISEIPHRNLSPLDQRSFGSESPGKKFQTSEREHSSVTSADQSSTPIQPLKNKIDQKPKIQKLKVEVPDKTIALKVIECEENNKYISTKGTELKLESTEMVEKKLSQATGHRKLAEIPEKKILKNAQRNEKMALVSPKTCAKKLSNSKNSYEDVKKLKDPKTKSIPEISNNDSPRSLSARMKKANYSVSPASSPSRLTKTCSSAKWLIVNASKEYSSSPMSSPLNPCTRCSRLGRQTSLPSTMSPRRNKTGHVCNPCRM